MQWLPHGFRMASAWLPHGFRILRKPFWLRISVSSRSVVATVLILEIVAHAVYRVTRLMDSGITSKIGKITLEESVGTVG